jgi:hypothetical protein
VNIAEVFYYSIKAEAFRELVGVEARGFRV